MGRGHNLPHTWARPAETRVYAKPTNCRAYHACGHRRLPYGRPGRVRPDRKKQPATRAKKNPKKTKKTLDKMHPMGYNIDTAKDKPPQKRKDDKKMKYRELMRESNENQYWCKPMISDHVKFTVMQGSISALIIDGEEVPATPENIKKAAKIVNPYYDIYVGWSDTYIASMGDVKEAACRECPWFGLCEVMDEEIEEENE